MISNIIIILFFFLRNLSFIEINKYCILLRKNYKEKKNQYLQNLN